MDEIRRSILTLVMFVVDDQEVVLIGDKCQEMTGKNGVRMLADPDRKINGVRLKKG